MNKRLYYIDWLKTISLFAIVVAHVQAPNIIAQIRSFDVILMVVCSGLLANRSNSAKSMSYLEYVVSRVKRLVLPTWIFLIIYSADIS